MICQKCGNSNIEQQIADLPFRLDIHKIVVLKDTPAYICESCGEIMLADQVMKKVDEIIDRIQDLDVELEVIRYAA